MFHIAHKIPLNEIGEFTIDKTIISSGFDVIPGKVPFVTRRLLKNPRGNIVIGLKQGNEKTILKKRYKKMITKYKYVRIKNVNKVFDIAEEMIDLGIHYVQKLMYKDRKICDYNDNVIKSYQYFFSNKR